MRRRTRVGLFLGGVALAAGCGGGPPVHPKDTVKSVQIWLRLGPGVVDALGLPKDFKALEADRRHVSCFFADPETCARIRLHISAVKPERTVMPFPKGPFGEVTIRTGWGRQVRIYWYGSAFRFDGWHFSSSQLSKALADAIEKSGPPASRPATGPAAGR